MPLFLVNPLLILMKNPLKAIKWLVLVFGISFFLVTLLSYRIQRDSCRLELAKITDESTIQKVRLEELSKQAETQNNRVVRTVTRIQKEAKNAEPEDNKPFNNSLLRTLNRLREIDQDSRDSK